MNRFMIVTMWLMPALLAETPPGAYIDGMFSRWKAAPERRDAVGLALSAAFIGHPLPFFARGELDRSTFTQWAESLRSHTCGWSDPAEPGRGAATYRGVRETARQWVDSPHGEMAREVIAMTWLPCP